MTQIQDVQHTQHTPPSQQREDLARLAMAAESLLFVAGRPLTYPELRKLLDVHDSHLTSVLDLLADQLEGQGRGIRLQRLENQAQLVTAPENARYIAALLGLPMTAKLTTAAMETLAVISYRQPITRAQIEAVRGVNSDRALASLIQHNLVAEVGRAPTVGRPALFATTSEFLQQFGLTSLQELPRVDQASLNGQNGRGQHPESEDLVEQAADEEQNEQSQSPEQEHLFEQTIDEEENGHQVQIEQEMQPDRELPEVQNGPSAPPIVEDQGELDAGRKLPAWAQDDGEQNTERKLPVQEQVEDVQETERELPTWAQHAKE